MNVILAADAFDNLLAVESLRLHGGADERLHQCFHNLIAAQLDVKDGLAAINAFERYL